MPGELLDCTDSEELSEMFAYLQIENEPVPENVDEKIKKMFGGKHG